MAIQNAPTARVLRFIFIGLFLISRAASKPVETRHNQHRDHNRPNHHRNMINADLRDATSISLDPKQLFGLINGARDDQHSKILKDYVVIEVERRIHNGYTALDCDKALADATPFVESVKRFIIYRHRGIIGNLHQRHHDNHHGIVRRGAVTMGNGVMPATKVKRTATLGNGSGNGSGASSTAVISSSSTADGPNGYRRCDIGDSYHDSMTQTQKVSIQQKCWILDLFEKSNTYSKTHLTQVATGSSQVLSWTNISSYLKSVGHVMLPDPKRVTVNFTKLYEDIKCIVFQDGHIQNDTSEAQPPFDSFFSKHSDILGILHSHLATLRKGFNGTNCFDELVVFLNHLSLLGDQNDKSWKNIMVVDDVDEMIRNLDNDGDVRDYYLKNNKTQTKDCHILILSEYWKFMIESGKIFQSLKLEHKSIKQLQNGILYHVSDRKKVGKYLSKLLIKTYTMSLDNVFVDMCENLGKEDCEADELKMLSDAVDAAETQLNKTLNGTETKLSTDAKSFWEKRISKLIKKRLRSRRARA